MPTWEGQLPRRPALGEVSQAAEGPLAALEPPVYAPAHGAVAAPVADQHYGIPAMVRDLGSQGVRADERGLALAGVAGATFGVEGRA